jgi:hypothetical protein
MNEQNSIKVCIACGMPMKTPEEFATGDTQKDYCKYCSRPDGTMQFYEEKLESLKNFIIRTQGLDEKAAVNAAKSMMAALPAWKSLNK